MKKLHSLAFYGLVAPLITFGAGSVLAQQSSSQPDDDDRQSTQQEAEQQSATQSGAASSQRNQTQSGQADRQGAQSTQSGASSSQSGAASSQREQSSSTQQRSSQPGATSQSQSGRSATTSSTQRTGATSSTQSSTYLSTAPANGIHAGNLIGSEVKSMNDETVGNVSDLVIDSDGQVAAIIVGVGGFLGVGEKDVAISWDSVTRSQNPSDEGVMVDVSRESLNSAPAFESNQR